MTNSKVVTICKRYYLGGNYMSKTIICKGCGSEIYKGAKKCLQCGKKNKKPIGLIIVGIIILLLIISSISGSIEDAESKKVEYSWPTTGIATLLPQPESVYGEINSESEDYFSIDVYGVSASEFKDYVDSCKEKGFTVDYTSTSSSYYADDENGNSLSLYYDDDEEEMNIMISAFKEETEKDTVGNDTTSETEEETEVDTSAQNDMEFRAWVDSYEEFMDEYVEFMKKYNESDGSDLSLLADYTSFLSEYSEFVEASEKINEDNLSAEDYKYYLDAQTRILEKLSEIQ